MFWPKIIIIKIKKPLFHKINFFLKKSEEQIPKKLKKEVRNKLPIYLIECDIGQLHWCHSNEVYIIMLLILQCE